MRKRFATLAAGAVLAGALVGCAGDEPRQSAGEPTSEPTEPSSSAPESAEPSEDETAHAGGTAEDPAPAEPTTNVLDWTRVPGPSTATVTRSGPWTLSVAQGGSRATLEGPGRLETFVADGGRRIDDALIDRDWAVVVFQDELETAPATAEVVPLTGGGGTFTVDESSDVPTTTGGTWALGDGRLVHPTIGPGGTYCLATVNLPEQSSERTWCAERRHGFNAARVTAEGTSLMTFDDRQPSCRTVVEVRDDQVDPFEGVAECLGWEGVLVGDGAVWSVVPKQTRIEEARYYARSGGDYFDLGPGTSGTLVPCAGDAYFAQDPVRDGGPARLLRWTSDGALEVVYETRGRGPAFLTEPRCGADRITVTALGESGDEQVSAPIG